MDYLQLEGELPELRKPTFVAAFRGWNDAGEAATLAVRHLIESWSAKQFAAIDPEEFFDFTVARPMIRITEEGQRDLQWPANRFFYHPRPGARAEGPPGIVGPLPARWRRAQLPAASLWVGLPPYLGETVNPRGAL